MEVSTPGRPPPPRFKKLHARIPCDGGGVSNDPERSIVRSLRLLRNTVSTRIWSRSGDANRRPRHPLRMAEQFGEKITLKLPALAIIKTIWVRLTYRLRR